jgi:hypothetical protein
MDHVGRSHVGRSHRSEPVPLRQGVRLWLPCAQVANHAQSLTYLPDATKDRPNPAAACSCLYQDARESIVVSCFRKSCVGHACCLHLSCCLCPRCLSHSPAFFVTRVHGGHHVQVVAAASYEEVKSFIQDEVT